MPQTFMTTGRVESGKLKTRNLQAMTTAFAGWKDCEVTILIERATATRSLVANAYYWGVVVHLISEHTGHTPEETHDLLKVMFLPKKLAMLGRNGDLVNELVIGGSTTKLNKVEFYEYCQRIREWSQDSLDLYIPRPDEYSEAA